MRRLLASACALMIVGVGLTVAAPGASASVTSATINPALWQVGTAPASTITVVNSGTTANPFFIIEWDWPTTLTAVTENATLSGSTYTCPTSGVTFTDSGTWTTSGTVQCVASTVSGATGVRQVTLNNATTSNNATTTIGIPAGITTATNSARGYGIWTLYGNVQFRVYTSIAPVPDTLFAPQPPQNVTAVKEYDQALKMDVIRVSWDAPSDSGSLPITHYSVYGGTEWGSPSMTGLNAGCMTDATAAKFTSCVVTSPLYGYTPVEGPNVFSVKAFNGLGWSGAATSNMVMIPFAEVAGAPTDVKLVPGRNSLVASWKAPADNGGLPITNYLASFSNGRICITRRADANMLTCSIGVAGTPDKITAKVQALNARGWGPYSEPSAGVSPWDVRLQDASRDKVLLGLFQRVNAKVAVPGLPKGTPVILQVQPYSAKTDIVQAIFNGTWTNLDTQKVGDSGHVSFKKNLPLKWTKTPVLVRALVFDPITKVAEETTVSGQQPRK